MVSLKYLSNFLRTREMSLINCKINLILTCSGSCAISSGNAANQTTTRAITQTNLYCSGYNFINSRLWKTIAAVEIRF